MKEIRIETRHIGLKKYQETLKELKEFLKYCYSDVNLKEVDEIIKENMMYGQSTVFHSVMKHLVKTVSEEISAMSNYKVEFGDSKVYLTYVVIGF